MKKLQVDILGKAPSLAEVEEYNTYHKNKSKIYLGLSLFCISFIGLFTMFGSFFQSYLFSLSMEFAIVSCLFLYAIFVCFTLSESFQREYRLSSDLCTHLLELSAKYPEIASYRIQVVAQGREFLQSEYEACTEVANVKACKELYSVGSVTGII